ncbi:MAG: hypothetical protein U9R19_03410, partial [Bacteroidota bacterium]|nr:hypothetical protein [Bacteroidota bacterium]
MKKVKFVVVISIISIFIIFNKGATVYGQQNNKAQAVSLFKQGYYSGAASLLKPLNQQFPKDAEINFYYGASLVNMQTNLEKAVIILADVSFSNDWPAAKFYLAKAYHLQYKFTEAKKYYRRFIDYSDKKTLENYNAQIQLEACDIAIRLIASATQIESRNIEQKSLLEIEDFLLQNNSGSWQIINNELKSKIDKKLPH